MNISLNTIELLKRIGVIGAFSVALVTMFIAVSVSCY